VAVLLAHRAGGAEAIAEPLAQQWQQGLHFAGDLIA
jgi:hypothetical protein